MASASRAERRRAERAAAKPHAWRVVLAFKVDEWQARQMMTTRDGKPPGSIEPGEFPAAGDDRVWLRAEMIDVDATPGIPMCWRCEEPWSEQVAARPCSGQPPGRLEYVQ
jgi:hypothetical protein